MLLTPFSSDDFVELNKSGLYFQPPITIINSKNIITLINNPIGIKISSKCSNDELVKIIKKIK